MSNQKKYLPLILGIAIAAGIFIGGKLNFTDTPERLFSTNSKKDKTKWSTIQLNLIQ
mgnify:CR=1 FL=1